MEGWGRDCGWLEDGEEGGEMLSKLSVEKEGDDDDEEEEEEDTLVVELLLEVVQLVTAIVVVEVVEGGEAGLRWHSNEESLQ